MKNQNSTPNHLRATAYRYTKQGLSVIPTNEAKEPTVKWKPYQEHIPTVFEINDMFHSDTYGIAVIGGKVSGNLEIIDVDSKYDVSGTMYGEFIAIVEKLAPGLMENLPVEKTTSGGFHILYRCSHIEGNLKLASRPATEEEKEKKPGETQKVLFETRGEGGYFVCDPTQGYEFIRGSFESVPEITPEEREILFQAAGSFDQLPKTHAEPTVQPAYPALGKSPFADYNERGDCVTLLLKHGWTVVLDTGSKVFLKRPGDTKSKQSGNYDKQRNWFTVFSTSTAFEIRKAYKPSAVFALLECNNDFKEAAKRLLEMGYGERSQRLSKVMSPGTPFPHDPFFVQAFADGYIEPNFDVSKAILNSVDLLKLDNSENRYLLSPFLPRVGTGVLAGAPDCGKSQFARQLCISVATGMNHFLDYGLTVAHGRALYVATEDDSHNTRFLFEQQVKGLRQKATPNLCFHFADTSNQQEILFSLDKHLTATPCDLVVVDSFGDVFIGSDSNNNQAMRRNVRNFDYFAKKHQCFILFVHHINKAAYKLAPNQAHIMGGGGLTQKVRLALQLSQGEGMIKYLTVVKGNYCPREHKENAMELTFEEKTFLFTRTGREIPIDLLNTDEEKPTHLDKLKELAEEILGKEPLTNKEFCARHNELTGKCVATAGNDLKKMRNVKMIVREGRKWALAK